VTDPGGIELNQGDVVKPFTPVDANPIHIKDFLRYVANHQDSVELQMYKDEYHVRCQFLSTVYDMCPYLQRNAGQKLISRSVNFILHVHGVETKITHRMRPPQGD